MGLVSKGVFMDYMGQQLAMQPQGGMMSDSSNAPDVGSRTAPLGSAPASLQGDQMKQLLIQMAQALALLQQKQAAMEQRMGLSLQCKPLLLCLKECNDHPNV
jgi:hypothetical protein